GAASKRAPPVDRGRLAGAGEDSNKSGVRRISPPKGREARGQGRRDALDMGRRAVGPNFGRSRAGEEAAGAEGNGAKRTVVKSLFDGSEEAMALFCVWRAIQQPRTGIVSCF